MRLEMGALASPTGSRWQAQQGPERQRDGSSLCKAFFALDEASQKRDSGGPVTGRNQSLSVGRNPCFRAQWRILMNKPADI